jgi:hypothetical protein
LRPIRRRGIVGDVKLELPPNALLLEARLQTGERWALLAFILLLVGAIGLWKGIPGVVAVLILCGGGAAAAADR